MSHKTVKAKPRPSAQSKLLKVKAGATAMKKVLKQNLRKVVIYENEPGLAYKSCRSYFDYTMLNKQHYCKRGIQTTCDLLNILTLMTMLR